MPTVFVSAMSTEMLPPHFEYDDVSDKVLIGQGGMGKHSREKEALSWWRLKSWVM